MKPMVYCLLPTSDENLTLQARERLAAQVNLVTNPYQRQMNDEEKIMACLDADVVIAGRKGGGLPLAAIEKAQKLKAVGVVGGAVKMVQPEELLRRDIVLFNTVTGMGLAVAEYTLALILNALRDIPYFIDELKAGRWWRGRRPYFNLTGKTVGLVGFGVIARDLVPMLQPFAGQILVYDPYVSMEVIKKYKVQQTDLDTLLQQSHVVSLHAGLTAETRHMIGQRELDLMRPHAILVNTARGALIDEEALVKKLHEGRLFAALNSYSKDPLPIDHPLRSAPNVILTPKGGGKTEDTFVIQSESLVDDTLRVIAGEEPRSRVDLKMLARMT